MAGKRVRVYIVNKRGSSADESLHIRHYIESREKAGSGQVMAAGNVPERRLIILKMLRQVASISDNFCYEMVAVGPANVPGAIYGDSWTL